MRIVSNNVPGLFSHFVQFKIIYTKLIPLNNNSKHTHTREYFDIVRMICNIISAILNNYLLPNF